MLDELRNFEIHNKLPLNQMFQFNFLHVLLYLASILWFSFSDFFAKTYVHCTNGQGGIVLSGIQGEGQLKILTFDFYRNLRYNI